MLNLVYTTAIVCLALLVVAATVLPFAPTHAWWVRAWDFPRVQILFLGGAVLIGALFLAPEWKWPVAALVIAACAYQAVRIFPYTPLAGKEMSEVPKRDGGSQTTILASNVEMPNDAYDKVTDLIADVDPDIVFLMETNEAWYDGVADGLSGYGTVLTELRENFYGMIFATRLKVHQAKIVYLTPDETPTLFADLETDDGRRFRFVGLHPRPPVPGNSTEDRDAQIIYSARFARQNDMPLIAVGDFNDAAWSDTSRRFKQVGGYVDPRVGRGLIASFDVKSRLLRAPIDQFYATPDIALVSFYRGPDVGSDHFPLVTRIELDPEVAEGANVPPPAMPDAEMEELDRVMKKYRDQLDTRYLPDPD